MNTQSRKKRMFKRIILILLIIIGLHAGITALLKWKVNSRIEALRRAGEPMYVQDMLGSPIPDSQNGAVELTKVINILESKTLPPNIADYIKYSRKEYSDKWWKQTDRELSANKHIFRLIEAGISKPRTGFTDDHIEKIGELYAYDSKLDKVRKILKLKILCIARNKQMHQTADTILDMMTLSNKFLTKYSPDGSYRHRIFLYGGTNLIDDALRYGEFGREDS